MKMPFDLNKFLAGAKVTTRDGRIVTHLTYFSDLDNWDYQLFGVIGNDDTIASWRANGSFYKDEEMSDYDLILSDSKAPSDDSAPDTDMPAKYSPMKTEVEKEKLLQLLKLLSALESWSFAEKNTHLPDYLHEDMGRATAWLEKEILGARGEMG